MADYQRQREAPVLAQELGIELPTSTDWASPPPVSRARTDRALGRVGCRLPVGTFSGTTRRLGRSRADEDAARRASGSILSERSGTVAPCRRRLARQPVTLRLHTARVAPP